MTRVLFLRESEAFRIPDPYDGRNRSLARVIDLLESGCAALLNEFPDSQH